MFLSLPSERKYTSTHVVTSAFFSYDLFLAFLCHFQIAVICLIYLFLTNLHCFRIRSMTMFLKVLNKVNFTNLNCIYTNLNYFLLLTYSSSQNSWGYQLLIIVRLNGRSFLFLGCRSCMGAHFSIVELDVIQFSTKSPVSKLACQFDCFFQYLPGLEVLACSFNTNLNYVTTMLQLHPSMNHSVKLQQLQGEDAATFWVAFSQICNLCSSLLDPRPFLSSLADFLLALAFLCYHYIFDSYVTCLTLNFNPVYYFSHIQIYLNPTKMFIRA